MTVAYRSVRIRPRCDALTATYSTDAFNANRLRCHQWLGVTGYVDRDGNDRHYCVAPGHRANVERRYPVRLNVCSFCGKDADSQALPVDYGHGELGLMCTYCCDRFAPGRDEDEE